MGFRIMPPVAGGIIIYRGNMAKFKFVSKQAVKENLPFRGMIWGVSGGGKTKSALFLAHYLREMSGDTRPIRLLDTENSAAKYGNVTDFEVTEVGPNSSDGITEYHPEMFAEWISEFGRTSSVLIIDSATHEWEACKQLANDIAAARYRGNSYAAWGEVTPMHNKFVQAIIGCPAHIIVTTRGKMEHVQEKDGNGRTTVRKVGLGIVQREGLEYEFDVVFQAYDEGNLVVEKTRIDPLRGKIFKRDAEAAARLIYDDLNSGASSTRQKYTYGNGEAVPDNPAVRQIFGDFVSDNGRPPTDRDELKQYNDSRKAQAAATANEPKSTAVYDSDSEVEQGE